MIYLTGVVNKLDQQNLIDRGFGLMLQPRNSYHRQAPLFPFHAADNGCFNARWEEDHWLTWLAYKAPVDRCLFATAPDVYPDAAATLERSIPFFEVIRGLGFPVALVAQDGAETLPIPWDDLDCIFLGGKRTPNPKNEWKTSTEAEKLANEARNRGKWVHMGRVNSLSRIARAREMGCLSVDGTFLKYRRRLCKGRAIDLDSYYEGGIGAWLTWLEEHPLEQAFENPSLPVYRQATTGGNP